MWINCDKKTLETKVEDYHTYGICLLTALMSVIGAG